MLIITLLAFVFAFLFTLCWDSIWDRILKRIVIQIKLSIKKKIFLFSTKRGSQKMLRWAFLGLYCLIVIWAFVQYAPLFFDNSKGETSCSDWFTDCRLIAHAGGHYYQVNSIETFRYSYEVGYRVFEGDLCLTSDEILVLAHDWETFYRAIGEGYPGRAPSYNEFINSRYKHENGSATPMDLNNLFEFMIKHEDVFFITDFKYCQNKSDVLLGFQQIVDTANKMGCPSVLDRFINYDHRFKRWYKNGPKRAEYWPA